MGQTDTETDRDGIQRHRQTEMGTHRHTDVWKWGHTDTQTHCRDTCIRDHIHMDAHTCRGTYV